MKKRDIPQDIKECFVRSRYGRSVFHTPFVLCIALCFIPILPWTSLAERGIFIEPNRFTASNSPSRYAVIVGVSRYENPRYDLEFAERDAQAIYSFLRTPEGGAFPSDNIRALLNEQATSSALRSALGTFLASASEEDYVIIYFAGHGGSTPNNPDDLYLFTYEVDGSDLAGTAFPMDEVKRYLEKSIKACRVLMIVDSCRSGGVKLMGASGGDHEKILFRYLKRLSQSRPGLVSITAGGASQLSLEGKLYGGGHGVFTYYLLQGLRDDAATADTNRDEVVDVAEIYEYVREKVKEETKGRQIPDKTGDLLIGIPLSVVSASQGHSALPRSQPLRVIMGMFKDVEGSHPVKVTSGDTLYSGDGYFFFLQAERPCYLYLFQLDSSGALYRLFPSAKYHTPYNPVKAGQELVLPNPRESYFLDQTVGREEVYLFASRDRIPELEGLEFGRRNDLMRDRLRLMGPAGVRKRRALYHDDRVKFNVTMDELIAARWFLHRIQFEHK